MKVEVLHSKDARKLTDQSDGAFARHLNEVFNLVRLAASKGESFVFLPDISDKEMKERVRLELQLVHDYDVQSRHDKLGIAW